MGKKGKIKEEGTRKTITNIMNEDGKLLKLLSMKK
jgi:hypothetical protein